MGSNIYDKGLLNKLKGWTSNTQLQVYGVDETRQLYETIADNNKDNPIELPLLTLTRNLGYSIINGGTTRRPLSYDGITYKVTDYDSYQTSTVINAIPISLSYRLDVYTRYAEQADVIMSQLIFNLINYPSFEVEIPKVEEKHTARITINDNVEDNSSITERFVIGNLTRLSISFSIDDAYLWDIRELHNVDIEIRVNDKMEF